jgi:phosphatidylglycerol:prolipoprotein diacylglycerol transferase
VNLTDLAALGRQDGPWIFWVLALVAGVAHVAYEASRCGLDEREAYWAAMAAVGLGLFGSRLLAMALYGGGDLLVGGRSFYGGFLGGALAAAAYLRVRRLPLLEYLDAMAPACALGYCLGRVGCFFNGDDYGVPAAGAFSVRYGPGSEAYQAQLTAGLIGQEARLAEPVLATQLLHAALGLLLFAALRRSRPEPGGRLGVLAIGYGLGRFGLEWLRGDSMAWAGALSVHQVLSTAVILAGGILLLRRRGLLVPLEAR